jgi:GNAT superfamily N-acetyltransferase
MDEDDLGDLHGVDEATMRRLLVHEARVHATPGRELRDMGDGLLLFDPSEPEPFWNRLEGLRWPTDPDAFDRRLAEALVLFTTLSRQPHVWPAPAFDQPADLAARLLAHGFRDMGMGCVMVLTDRDRPLSGAPRRYGPEVSLERLSASSGRPPEATVDSIAAILCGAFDIDEGLRPGVRREIGASLDNTAFTYYLVRLSGEPAAVAKRATFDGLSYLSSIGTADWARGRGLGELVTATATADAIAAGSEWIHLGVFADNTAAIRLYRRVGFQLLGRPAPDLLLIG